MIFSHFKNAVAAQFKALSSLTLLRVDIDKDALWQTYLASFPEGSNPLYRVRTEHDCSCCRQFIKAVGDVVAIKDGKVVTIWDIAKPDKINPAYAIVAQAMADLVRSRPIKDYFLHYEKTAGTDRNFEALGDSMEAYNDYARIARSAGFKVPSAEVIR